MRSASCHYVLWRKLETQTSGYTATGSLSLDRAAGRGRGANEELSSTLLNKGAGGPTVYEIPREGQKESSAHLNHFRKRGNALPFPTPVQKPRYKDTCGPASPERRTFPSRGNPFHEDSMGLILLSPWSHDPGLSNQNIPSYLTTVIGSIMGT